MSDSFRYELMLDIEEDFNPSDKSLNALSKAMAENRERIPSGYTYLGQFIDHDISLDSAVVDGRSPWGPIPSTTIYNMRTPMLNLETIYGFNKPTNRDEPAREHLLKPGSKSLLRLGDTAPGIVVSKVFSERDLPRIKRKPLIVDQRNDENLAVAQTQVAFMRFHNAVVRHLGGVDSEDLFEQARQMVILHYQWIIVHDYLPKIVKKSVLFDVLNNGNKFYFPDPRSPFIPIEFSTAAFRTSHSMIRNSYNWNRIFNDEPASRSSPARLYELMRNTGHGGLGGRDNLMTDWLINWNWFFNLSQFEQNQRFNFAMPIDTKIASQLGFLLDSNGKPPANFARESSLAAFDLYRSRASNVPSGQAVAKTIWGTNDCILDPQQIANLLPEQFRYSLSNRTPLWFYLLAEAELEEQGQRLGEVGSRLVVETLVELIKLTQPNIFTTFGTPDPKLASYDGEFGMIEMLRFIADGDPSELNPLGDEPD